MLNTPCRGQRKISLRFLAWYLLKIDMQTSDFGHDSVEDAAAALRVRYALLQ